MITPIKVVMHECYGELIMFGPHQHPHPKRRKKRPIHGVKTVDVTRGKSGYGFTISGQHPCVLSCIVNHSPAAQVGLRPGDYLISVNGRDVSKLGHDEVVRMVGMSTGTLTIQVAENYNSSDSSDEDYVPRSKLKYPNRAKRGHHHKGYGEKMEKLLADINQRDRYCPDGHSHDQNSRPLNTNKNDMPKSRSSRPRLHTPVGAENHEIEAQGTSYIEAGASNVFKVPFQKSVSTSNVPSVPTHHRVEPKQAFIKSTSQIHFRSNPNINGASGIGNGLSAHVGSNVQGHMYDHFSPNSLQQIINHSLHSYSAANEAFILDEFDDDGDDDPLKQDGGEIKIVVGYIGSLEMPGDVTQPHVRIQSIRNSVRRLRLEQKIHTLVLMVVSNNGVRLINIGGKEIANYTVDRLVFCGVCPDDRRFFGIVTLNLYCMDSSSDSDSRDDHASSSCHIFMVDQEMASHSMHAQKAKYFGIVCSLDPHTQRCMEFPRSTTPVIMSISNLYKDRPGGSLENDVARSKVLSDPNRPVEPDQSSSASSSVNSNSDSGLGLCRDDIVVDQALVVDMPPPPPPPLPARDRPPTQYPQIKWSGNTVHLTEGPVKHFTPNASDKLASNKSRSPNVGQHDTSTSSEEFVRATGKLNIRAMPDPSLKRDKENDGLEYQNAAENLRKHSQKLLHARRQVMLDQTSSDTESVSSRSDKVSSVINAKERPVSAPFKYLSDDSNVGLRTSSRRSDVENVKHDSDSSLMDKLSPRAFLSSAFTPVGSVGSAFKKIKSRPLLHELRSPSAPPIPSYHGDDEDSEEEAVKGIIKQLQKERGLGLLESSGSNSKKTRKRDQERRAISVNEDVGEPIKPQPTSTNNTDKWVKTPVGSARKKSTRRNPLSLSHESLVVFDQDPAQQKLSSASSVNSIVNHVAKSIEQEEVGRVSGWAVGFHKLLRDDVGISVFTDFLKKEFSDENIEFWKVCETYKNVIDSNFRKSKAKEIYDSYVSVRAQTAVNIDSVARKHVESELESPTPQTYDLPQHQIFQLMKQDSYARFLKSELYKSWLMKEMEGQPLELSPEDSLNDKEKLLDKALEKDGKKKGKGKENEDNKEKRRRSLLPWRQKSKKNKEDKNSKASKDTKDIPEVASNNNNNNVPKSTNSTPLTDLPGSRKESNTKKDSVQVEVPETIEEEMDQPRFCRVIMPDGSTTVVGTKQGQTINYVLGKLLEKRSMSIASVDVFLLGSEKPLNLNEDIAVLGSKEVTIERRVLFRMDLPNKKSIGVKAKPNRLIRDVFKPILNKYGFRIDAIDVHLCGHSESLNLDNLVSTIDSQRVIVLIQSDESTARKNSLFGRYIHSSLPITNMLTSKLGLFMHQNSNNNSNMVANNNMVVDGNIVANNNMAADSTQPNDFDPYELDELTNQIFGDLMVDKSDQFIQPNFDELGILDLGTVRKVQNEGEQVPLDLRTETRKKGPTGGQEASTKEPLRLARTKPKVTFALQKNTVRNPLEENDVEKALCERLKRAQDFSLDDQRGLAPIDLQLPEFLQKNKEGLNHMTGRGSAPALLMHDKNDSMEKRDFMSEIDDYIENITENFAAYTKESSQQKMSLSSTDPRKLTSLKTFRSLDDTVDRSDSSFSQDGIVPSHDEADKLFETPRLEDADFDDPQFTEKSLTDIGFSYDYNKYLSKSRNFVNQRNRLPNHVSVQPDILNAPGDTFSPNRTLREENDEGLDSTLLNSPKVSHGSRHSSPYSSDSSVDKENFGKSTSQSSVNKVQRNSRHTLTHSPITTLSGDTFLSTVDTDGKMVRHSTPKTTGIKVNTVGNMSSKALLFNTQTAALNVAHSDEITFV